MKKLRCSYTLLSMWRSGRFQDAINYYLKIPTLKNKAMEDGIKYDKYVNEYVSLNAKLPIDFGGDTLLNPKCQVKVVKDLNSEIDVVGVFDVLTDDTLYEIKTGNSKDSADYATDFQVSMYLMLAPETVKKAYIIHFDQYSNKHDRSLIWNTPQERERGKNYVESLSSEIYTYFSQNNLLDI